MCYYGSVEINRKGGSVMVAAYFSGRVSFEHRKKAYFGIKTGRV